MKDVQVLLVWISVWVVGILWNLFREDIGGILGCSLGIIISIAIYLYTHRSSKT